MSISNFFQTLIASLIFAISQSGYAGSDPIDLNPACVKFLNGLPSTVKRQWVGVPEDWANPKTSKKINILVYYEFDFDATDRIPVLYLNGGPLNSSWGNLNSFKKFTDTRNINVIYMDQRGTGCSHPLNFDLSTESLEIVARYSSIDIAKDAEAVRKILLQDRPWKILGASFGGGILERYIDLYPSQLISAHGFGVPIWESMADAYFQRIWAQQDIMKSIEYVYPGTIAKIKSAKLKLTDLHCLEADGNQLCGPEILDLLAFKLAGMPPKNKELIDKLIPESGDLNLETAKTELSYLVKFFISNQFLYAAILNKLDYASVRDEMLLDQDCDLGYQRLENQGIKKSDLVIDECTVLRKIFKNTKLRDVIESIMPKIKVVKQITAKDVVKSLKKSKHLKFYIYTGGFDPLVGYQGAFQLQTLSSQIVHRHYAWISHSGIFYEPEIWDRLEKN